MTQLYYNTDLLHDIATLQVPTGREVKPYVNYLSKSHRTFRNWAINVAQSEDLPLEKIKVLRRGLMHSKVGNRYSTETMAATAAAIWVESMYSFLPDVDQTHPLFTVGDDIPYGDERTAILNLTFEAYTTLAVTREYLWQLVSGVSGCLGPDLPLSVTDWNETVENSQQIKAMYSTVNNGGLGDTDLAQIGKFIINFETVAMKLFSYLAAFDILCNKLQREQLATLASEEVDHDDVITAAVKEMPLALQSLLAKLAFEVLI